MTLAPAPDVTALVIDDNPFMRVILRTILSAVGVRAVTEAGDAPDGFELLNTRTYDLVLTDMRMQPMDGIEFTHLLRRATASRNRLAPVILVSGHATSGAIAAARDAGADFFLAKPVSARAVREKVWWVLNRRRPMIIARGFVGPCRRARASGPLYAGPRRRLDDHPDQDNIFAL